MVSIRIQVRRRATNSTKCRFVLDGRSKEARLSQNVKPSRVIAQSSRKAVRDYSAPSEDVTIIDTKSAEDEEYSTAASLNEGADMVAEVPMLTRDLESAVEHMPHEVVALLHFIEASLIQDSVSLVSPRSLLRY